MDLIGYILSAFGTLFVGIFGWVLRIDARVSVQEKETTNLKDWIDEKTENVLTQVNLRADMTEQRLNRIERALNGYMKHE
jgi:hypothetical protein